jgi:uncharacterized protein with HEPN domain
MNRDEASLLDIARAASLIQEFTSGSSFEAFRTDQKTQSAVQHQLLIVGEAVKRLSSDFRAQHPQIPWSLIADMRDHLIHAYDAIDLVEVWKTATNDIPQLLAYIQPLLPSGPR